MKKLLNIFGIIGLTIIGVSNIISCDNKEKKENDLETIITVTDLNEINFSGSVPTKEELLVGIQNKNTDANSLTVDDFDIESGQNETNATITGIGEYSGTISINYSKKQLIKLNSKINTTSLNEIAFFGSVPTKEELLVGIKNKNHNANNLTIDDFEIESGHSAIKATIIGIGEYSGKITLTYSKQ